MSDDERVEGSSALRNSGSGCKADDGDRADRALPTTDWPRNGQAVRSQLTLPGMTEELFLAAGEVLAGRCRLEGSPTAQVEAMHALAVVQGAAARFGCRGRHRRYLELQRFQATLMPTP